MHHVLAIDLRKAGKKGTRWKKHTYLARMVRPDGSIEYVYPDKKVDGYFLDNGQFQLNAGVSLAGIINRELFGGPSGFINPKTGKPLVRDGKFRHYVVVSDAELEQQRYEAQRAGRPAPYQGALGYETIGGWRVYEYSRTPLVGHDKDGKPIYGGFLAIEFHPSIISKYGYKPSARLMQQQVTDPKQIALAQDVSIGGTIPAGKPAISEQHPSLASTAPPGTISIHAPIEITEETAAALGIELEETADPLKLAQKFLLRLQRKKENRPEMTPGLTVLKPFPAWVVAKFRDEQEMLDLLQKKPMSTMITLGLFKPKTWSTKMHEQLHREWAPLLVGLSRRDFDAYKYTENYEHFRKEDETDGGNRVNKYRRDVMQDLMQNGVEQLLTLAHKYQATDKPNDRFDRYAYAIIDRTMRRESAKQAIHEKTFMPIVHEGNMEEAARRQGGKEPLSPPEMVELSRVTPAARVAFHRIFHDPHMPETYKRILAARLWLDDSSAAEATAFHERGEEAEAAIDAAADTGVEVVRPRSTGKWMREFTGRADSLAEVYPEWTDPKTGNVVDMTKTPQKTQFRRLSAWWAEARGWLLRELSVPLARVDPHPLAGVSPKQQRIPEAEWRGTNIIDAPVELALLSAEEKQFFTAAGWPKTEARVLTSEGKAVKRYLELETKLARENRRRWTEAVHAELPTLSITPQPSPAFGRQLLTPVRRVMLVPHKPIVGPRAISLPSKMQPEVHPAVAFFTASPNQALARRLGLQLERLDRQPSGGGATGGGVFASPHITIGFMAQRELDAAQQQYTRLMHLRALAPNDLQKEYNEAHGQLHALQALGSWQQTKGTLHWHPGEDGVTTLHRAAVAYANARQTILDKQAIRVAKREHLANTGFAEVEIRQRLKPYQSTSAEKQTLKDAGAEYQRVVSQVVKVVPKLVQPYEQALRSNAPIHDHLVQGAKAALTKEQRDVAHRLALMQFESDRRVTLSGMTKALMSVDVLDGALSDFDFEVSRLAAEIFDG
jgi:hypothetical protein